MTKFADQLFDDLMREHGLSLAQVKPPAHLRRHVAAHRAVLAGGGTVAVAGVIAGVLVAGGTNPAARIPGGGSPGAGQAGNTSRPYSVTKNPDGTITLDVYRKSGIAGANARLRQLGDSQVVVVPIEAGCPAAPPPAVPTQGDDISTEAGRSVNGSVTVNAQGIPAGDILVVGFETSGDSTGGVGVVTSPPAPSCISPPASPSGTNGSGQQRQLRVLLK
jgi:hypothetical protein